MGASEKIYPAGGVLHQGEGPWRKILHDSSGRLSTGHRTTLAEAEAMMYSLGIAATVVLIRRVFLSVKTPY